METLKLVSIFLISFFVISSPSKLNSEGVTGQIILSEVKATAATELPNAGGQSIKIKSYFF